VAVVDGGPESDTEIEAVRQLDLPAGVDVGLAGVAVGVDRAADRRTDRAAEDRQCRRQQQLAIDVDAALEPEPAPEVGHVVV
jgi:hypothetical protein